MRRIGLLVLLFVPMAAFAVPAPQLNQRQTILEAHRTLLAAGWQPAPETHPSPGERHWSGVSLNSRVHTPVTSPPPGFVIAHFGGVSEM